MKSLKVKNLSVPFSNIDPRLGKDAVINNISFSVEAGKIFGVVGPTGSGKSILLRTLAGVINADNGEILKDGENITLTPPSQRNMAMVFQDYVLYPHMNAKSNILFRLFSKKDPAINKQARLDEIATMLGINEEKLLNRMPRNISGGEKQRVAIGKAIASLPEILLLDEPFSNIEENKRYELRHNLRKLIRENNIAAVYVSHNQVEIAEIADTMAVMHQGRFEQTGTFINLYSDPKRYFVSLFIGEKTTNFIRSEDVASLTGNKIRYKLTIRPDECGLEPVENSIKIEGEVALIEKFIPDKKQVAFIDWKGELFGVELPIDYEIEKWQRVAMYIPLDKSKFFDESGDRIYNLW
jgi:ABC-type sugar transport system ATPase subunit